jgi:ribose transport system permease protein
MTRLQPVIDWARSNGLFFALVILTAIFATLSNHFLTASNFKVILQQVSVTGIIAVPGAMLILSNYVDLSVGSVSVLAAVVFGQFMTWNAGLPASVLFGLAAGVLWGVLNGFLIAGLGFSPIIVTLGGLAGARGVAELITQGFTTYGYGRTFSLLGNGTLLSVPVPVWIFVLIFVIGLHVWYRTPIGRHMVAIGGAREAARSLGIRITTIPFWLYVCSGAASALGGLIVASELDGAAVTIGTGTELDVLTGILLGGVSFTGGRGTLFGVLFGVLFIGVLSNGLVQVNISPYFEAVAVGIALVFAAGLDILYQRLERVQIRGRAEHGTAYGLAGASEEDAS